jgi:regulator of sirC expression with transglutaminase-like and TPR domain
VTARIDRRALIGAMAGLIVANNCPAQSLTSCATAVSAILDVPDARLDYLQSKLAIDRVIDPRIDRAGTQQTIERMAATARSLAGVDADDADKLAAVRTLIYQAGPWNDNRPFAYDHNDPLGHDVRNKLLATYVRTRLGNCVSMPILFLILGDRLGANVSLAQAPHHLLIRWRQSSGREINLECTSGGLPARDLWYRRQLPPITDEALAHGVYLHALSRRENVAAMATTVMEYLYRSQRYQEAIDVGGIILEASPNDAQTMVMQASCYGAMIHDEFEQRYPTPNLIPADLRPRYEMLESMNEQLFARAEALGWQEGS